MQELDETDAESVDVITEDVLYEIATKEIECKDKDLLLKARQWFALTFKVRGHTFESIATLLQVSPQYVHKIYKRVMEDKISETSSELLKLQDSRYEVVIQSNYEGVESGDPQSTSNFLGAMSGKNKLHGLEKAALELSNPDGSLAPPPAEIVFKGVSTDGSSNTPKNTE